MFWKKFLVMKTFLLANITTPLPPVVTWPMYNQSRSLKMFPWLLLICSILAIGFPRSVATAPLVANSTSTPFKRSVNLGYCSPAQQQTIHYAVEDVKAAVSLDFYPSSRHFSHVFTNIMICNRQQSHQADWLPSSNSWIWILPDRVSLPKTSPLWIPSRQYLAQYFMILLCRARS